MSVIGHLHHHPRIQYLLVYSVWDSKSSMGLNDFYGNFAQILHCSDADGIKSYMNPLELFRVHGHNFDVIIAFSKFS